MSRKPVPWFAVLVTLVLVPTAAPKCRGDEFDDKLKQFQKQRAGEAQALKREVADALGKADTLAVASPAKAKALLRTSLTRLLDDSQLPRDERLTLVRQLKERLQALPPEPAEAPIEVAHGEPPPQSWTEVHGTLAAMPHWSAQKAKSHDWLEKTDKAPQGKGQLLGGAVVAPFTPVVSAGRRYVRLNVSGTFFFPNINNSYVPIQSAIPNIFYTGAPFGVTFGQPRNIFQVWVRQPQFTPISIQSGGLLLFP